jgi:C4-dicarboxylate-specific signal transduction histidine kinase
MNWKSFPKHLIPWILVLVVGVGVAFYILLGRGAGVSISDQILNKQEVLARAEASNIFSFFRVFGESIAVVSRTKAIQLRNQNAIPNMDAFIEEWGESDLVRGIALTDKNGTVVLNSNVIGTRDIGTSLVDRDYFLWAKTGSKEGEYYVGSPVVSRFGATLDDPIIPVAAAVYRNGTFTGVLVAVVDFHNLTKNYLELMHISNSTDVFLVDQSGKLIYSNNFSEGEGLNLIEYLEQNPFYGSQKLSEAFVKALELEGEGGDIVKFIDPVSHKLETHIVAYSPILMGSQNWLLVVSSPIENGNIWGFAVPIYIRLLILGLLFGLTIFMFGAITIKEYQKRL